MESKRPDGSVLVWLLGTVLLNAFAYSGAIAGAQSGPPVCVAEKPTVLPGETIWVRAHIRPLGNSAPQFAWTASAGRVMKTGEEVLWSFSRVQPGPQTIQAKVTLGVDATMPCEARVLVLQPGGERGYCLGPFC